MLSSLEEGKSYIRAASVKFAFEGGESTFPMLLKIFPGKKKTNTKNTSREGKPQL